MEVTRFKAKCTELQWSLILTPPCGFTRPLILTPPCGLTCRINLFETSILLPVSLMFFQSTDLFSKIVEFRAPHPNRFSKIIFQERIINASPLDSELHQKC